MAKKKTAAVADDDLLKDEGGEWETHEPSKASSLEFEVAENPNDVDEDSVVTAVKPDDEEDEPVKKVSKKKDEDEDLLADPDVDPDAEVDLDAEVDPDLEAEADVDPDAEIEASDEVDPDDEVEYEDQEPGGDFLSPWEKKNYSKAMAGRVSRERRLKREAEDRTVEAEGEVEGLKERASKAEKLALDLLVEKVESDIEIIKGEMLAAKEEGDNKAEIDASTKLQEALIKKRDLERTVEAQPKETEKPAAAKTDAAPVQKQPAPPTPQLKRWLERNRWFQNMEFVDEEGFARSIDAALSRDPSFKGRPGSPEFFAELDRRIHKKMPQLRSKIKKVFGTKPAAKTAGVNRGSTTVSTKRNDSRNPRKVVLTAEDIENARSFGITTTEGLKAYAANKFKRENEERTGSK